jgi:hypothetical protein
VVQPGDTASCSFPIAFDLQVTGAFQLFSDSSGQPARLVIHQHWTGTGSANGKQVIEHAAQTDATDLVTGESTNVGQIHDQTFTGGVVIHDVGLLRFDSQGNLTFEVRLHPTRRRLAQFRLSGAFALAATTRD